MPGKRDEISSSILSLEIYQLQGLIQQRVRFFLFYSKEDEACENFPMQLLSQALYVKGVSSKKEVKSYLKSEKASFQDPIVLASTGKWSLEIAEALEGDAYENVCYYQHDRS